MGMRCEKCEKTVSASEGKFVYYQGMMVCACKACAAKMLDEIKCSRQVCAAVDDKKAQADKIINNKDAYEKFLTDIDGTLKKIPNVGNLLSDIPFLVSLVKSYVTGEYTDIPYNTLISVVSALLYVISPFDMLPDVLPGVGYEDDAMVVALCIKMRQGDLEGYKAWRMRAGA